MKDKAELIRVIVHARIELLFVRSVLRSCIDDPELSHIVTAMLSRCGDTIKEADLLIEKIRPQTGVDSLI